eukprot:5903307-Lingulodinium_polyedra.AAC.1
MPLPAGPFSGRLPSAPIACVSTSSSQPRASSATPHAIIEVKVEDGGGARWPSPAVAEASRGAGAPRP